MMFMVVMVMLLRWDRDNMVRRKGEREGRRMSREKRRENLLSLLHKVRG